MSLVVKVNKREESLIVVVIGKKNETLLIQEIQNYKQRYNLLNDTINQYQVTQIVIFMNNHQSFYLK